MSFFECASNATTTGREQRWHDAAGVGAWSHSLGGDVRRRHDNARRSPSHTVAAPIDSRKNRTTNDIACFVLVCIDTTKKTTINQPVVSLVVAIIATRYDFRL
jgi:hypothetical protein